MGQAGGLGGGSLPPLHPSRNFQAETMNRKQQDKQLNILPMSYLNTYQTCNFIFKLLFQPVPSPLPCKDFFQFNNDVHHLNTRQANQLHLPKFRTGLCQFSIRYRGAQIWNNYITISSNSTSSINHFKSKIRIHLINQIA